jgi:hypothetical protein
MKSSRALSISDQQFPAYHRLLSLYTVQMSNNMSLCKLANPLLVHQLICSASFIPPSPTGGILPYWMLLISSAAFYNVAQSYVVLWQTKEIYGNKPEQGTSIQSFLIHKFEEGETHANDLVSPLTSRLLGTWNLLSAIIRFRTAYNITDPS